MLAKIGFNDAWLDAAMLAATTVTAARKKGPADLRRWPLLDEADRAGIAGTKEVSAGDRAEIQREMFLTPLV